MCALIINPDGSEQVRYLSADLPVSIGKSRLSQYHGYAAACHWHDDFEMLTVPQGEIDCFVNGKTLRLRQGEGIFVNARRLHYGFSAEKRDCRYSFVVFHPDLLGGASAVRQAVAALSADGAADCWLLDASSEAILIYNELYAAAEAGDALRTLMKCAELMVAIRERAQPREPAAPPAWNVLRKMTGYVQAHYADPITLNEIAAAGAVCRSRCCALFREHLGCTPIEYATRYRLDKAGEMLRAGCTVTEAALNNGFHGASYFAEVFRRVYGMSPRDYQRENIARP